MSNDRPLSRSEIEHYYHARVPGARSDGANRMRARCPIHDGKSPTSFAIDLESGRWYCHSTCLRGGDVFHLEMELGRIDFGAAKRSIYELVGRPAPEYHPDKPASSAAVAEYRASLSSWRITATYVYEDAQGNPVYRAVRREKAAFGKAKPEKKFALERHADGVFKGGSGNMDGVVRVPYRLPQLIEAIQAGQWVFLVEGEKNVESLVRQGLPATTNPQGAGKWSKYRHDLNPHFHGANIALLPDNDDAGRKHALSVADQLLSLVKELRIVELPDLPDKGDAVDWLESGGTREELMRLVMATPPLDAKGLAAFRQLWAAPEPPKTSTGKPGRKSGPHLAGPSAERADLIQSDQFQETMSAQEAATPSNVKPQTATPSTHTVGSVAEGSVGVAYKAKWIRNASGTPRPIISNVLDALRFDSRLVGLVAWDEFASKPVVKKSPPWSCQVEIGSEWPEQFDVLLAEFLQREGLMVGTALVMEAVQAIARENGFHPVRDYFDSLIWDGEPRLDSVLSRYFGAMVSEYTVQVGRKWFISAVVRIYRPGCKVDTMLILEGFQGAGKSRGLSIIGGRHFTDALGDIRTKEAIENIQGKHIVEVSEMSDFNRAEEAAMKAWLSRPSDRFRPAYGRRAVDAPRQCVFVGTTNGEAYLKDVTGARRFWPVKCGKVDVEALERDRDQIWAEAVYQYHEGATWWLSDALEVDAKAEQAARREEDVWTSKIEEWLEARDSSWITTNQLLTSCLDISISKCTQADQKRVAKCLKVLGFTRAKIRTETGTIWAFRREE